MVVRRFYGPRPGLMLTIASLLSVITWVAVTKADNPLPRYKLRYGVYYNSSGSDIVTTECGTHYAKTFLENFIGSREWMKRECRRNGVQGSLAIEIANSATVKLYATQVEVSTVIYVDSGSMKDLQDCARVVNDSVQRQERVNHFNFRDIRFLEGQESANCSSATMSPANFYFQEARWTCGNENFTIVFENWTCMPNPGQQGGLNQEDVFYTSRSDDYEDMSRGGDPTTSLNGDKPQGTVIPNTMMETTNDIEKNTISSERTTVAMVTAVLRSLSSEIPHTEPTEHAKPSPQVMTSEPPKTEASDDMANFHQYWGIELMDNLTLLRLEEGDSGAALRVRLWADRAALCNGLSSLDCQVTFNISIASGEYRSPVCRKTGELIPQVVFGRPTMGHQTGTPFCSMVLPENVTNEERQTTSLLVRAVSDNKYDGTQHRQLAFSLAVIRKTELFVETFHRIPIEITDLDRKATCQSINDPHITTFDGLEYNNYFEGEYVLYSHKELPATVHVVYQKCSASVPASCNCAVAVQSGDDVVVIDRCFRDKKPMPRISGQSREMNPMSVRLYLNGGLTPGTKVYQEADGKKYYIYLPHGTYVKVLISGLLVNAWIVASPSDLYKTKGLCGMYDGDKNTDMIFPNGTRYHSSSILSGSRGQPVDMMLSWRVDIDSRKSLLKGVPRHRIPYDPPQYCQCQEDAKTPYCAYSAHVDNCDIIQGVDVTKMLLDNAIRPSSNRSKGRKRRDVDDNTISVISRDDPILVDKHFIPPKYKWSDQSKWNEVTAKDFCTQYIRDNYTIGQLCSLIVPSVNFNQDISTCVEDIQIIGNTTWASSARDAMKEQCLEEIQKNGSLSNEAAERIKNSMCITDCSGHGNCDKGACSCEAGYTSADCSVSEVTPPYAGEMPRYGLCDIRTMNCSRVIVYGENFNNSNSLMCCFQECEVNDKSYKKLDTKPIISKALFINFNAVECTVPEVRPYLVSVSNNGGLNKSDPLLFLPFDPQCSLCSTMNTSCTKIRNSCIIDGRCYSAGESSPNNECLVCEPHNEELQWTTQDEMKCQTPWWNNFKLPSWAVAVPAAIGGSIVGVLAGFLFYKCCCKHNKTPRPRVNDTATNHVANESSFEDAILHRNRNLPVFSNARFDEVNIPQPEREYEESYFFNDGRGVENGVDSTTYF